MDTRFCVLTDYVQLVVALSWQSDSLHRRATADFIRTASLCARTRRTTDVGLVDWSYGFAGVECLGNVVGFAFRATSARTECLGAATHSKSFAGPVMT